MKEYHVWQNALKPDVKEPLKITLPDSVNAETLGMPADKMAALTHEEIKERINSPFGMETIASLAKKGSEAVIVFDDISRGTPVEEIAKIVLEELAAGGIEGRHVRFLCAVGNHAPLMRDAMVLKLGEDIVKNYMVYNHNPYEHNVKIGVDSLGRDVKVNREFLSCDVRIGIGSISPHPMNGYGGGGKLIFPGLADIKTTESNHKRKPPASNFGSVETCEMRSEIENMTKLITPFFKIDALINSKLDIVDLYAGDPIEEFYEGIKQSSKINLLERRPEKDLVIVNANAKANEAFIAVKVAENIVKEGGDIVMINHCRFGRVIHYYFDKFGADYGGAGFVPNEKRPRLKCGRVILYTPYPELTAVYNFNEPDKVVFVATWEEVLSLLDFGKIKDAAIISDGSISYFKQE